MVRLSILSFVATVDQHEIALQKREWEVVAALALSRGGLERELLAEMIWPDLAEGQARNNLKVYVNRLRRLLGAHTVVSSMDGYALSPATVVDVGQIEAILDRRLYVNDREHALLVEAAQASLTNLDARVRGWEWFAPHAPRLERIVRLSALTVAERAFDRGLAVEALKIVRPLFERDPSDASTFDVVRRAHVAMGDRASADRIGRIHENAVRGD